MDSDDEIDHLMGGDVGQRMSSFMRRKKGRLEKDEKILEEINVKKRNDPHFRTRRWEGRPPYEMSCWGRMLVHPRTKDPTDSKGGVLFRRRFRVPYPLFERLVAVTRANAWFSERNDAVGRKCAPLELKLLGVVGGTALTG